MQTILLCLTLTAPAADPVSFNDAIRPILADRCFACHGPDSAQRQADLRLDEEADARRTIEPGKPEESELLLRLSSDDSDYQMPPPESKLSVSAAEVELIRRWIEQGANWEQHWAFTPPVAPPVPQPSQADWPINAIDHFVLNRLDTAELRPSPMASKEHWLRRVTFDLTGLPPTLAEIDQFLADSSPASYERVVDRLLRSPAFGERMATEWLDVSRYGDTDGLFEDHPRSIYPWRDWVVEAFNSNLPYDEFLTWQLAGDLLPDATIQQRIATGFLRNNPTSNEGGIIDEDYRIKYLVDRVNTTATAMLGLTLECAQCHDHKYDPMTQREYYQFAGFFNSLVGNGNTKGATAPVLRNYSGAQRQRMEELDREVAALNQMLQSTPEQFTHDYQAWLKQLEAPVTWRSPEVSVDAEDSQVDDDGWIRLKPAPTPDKPDRPTMPGRFVRVALPPGKTGFLTLSEVEVFAGGVNIARQGRATQSSVGYSSPATKAIDGNRNGSFGSCSCTNEEKDAWWEIDLGKLQPIESVAVWNRTDCCPERLDQVSIRILDADRKIVAERVLGKAASRNALPKDADDGNAEKREFIVTLRGDAASTITALQWESRGPTEVDIQSVHVVAGDQRRPVDLLGKAKRTLAGEPAIIAFKQSQAIRPAEAVEIKLATTNVAGLRIQCSDNPTIAERASVPKEADKRAQYFRDRWEGFAEEREQLKQRMAERKKIENAAPLTMVAADMPTPRDTFVLMRGEYDRKGDKVSPAALASIMPYPAELPANRIGLASWVTSPDHPLTARVAVNRYWQMMFGVGLVKTSEDFGTQGERPSHPQLLDYLATDFVQSGWDVKRLIRQIALSATYRQSTARTAAIGKLDPENRLLSHMTRRRLPAEFIRDHALATSGLLNPQRGGPGVHPYQPAELFGRNAIGSANAKFTQSTGEDLYRRSLYTYWKRQIPAANLRILGADGRTKCRMRREKTNTPLQALVLLNDPQFVEAARALAVRSMQHGGASPDARLAYAFRLATSRRVQPRELTILREEFEARLREFQADAALTTSYLNGGGEYRASADLPPAELAAYAAVCSLILNLDESISLS